MLHLFSQLIDPTLMPFIALLCRLIFLQYLPFNRVNNQLNFAFDFVDNSVSHRSLFLHLLSHRVELFHKIFLGVTNDVPGDHTFLHILKLVQHLC